MTYLNDQILKSLKKARKDKGLSQRELSAKSGVPQSHISKIESGAVDLRVSSLVLLARTLGLELELIPRKAVPAIQSIVRRTINSDLANVQRRKQKEMESYRKTIDAITSSFAFPSRELEGLNKITNEIVSMKLNMHQLDSIMSSNNALKRALDQNSGFQKAIDNAMEISQTIRNALAHSGVEQFKQVLPAYSLDDEVGDE